MLGSIVVCILAIFSTVQQAAAEIAPPPLVADIYPEDVANEREYADWLRREHEALVRSTEQAASGTAAKLLAFHANWTLAVHCEPHVTRLLFHIHRPEDISALEALSRDALERLSRVRKQWPAEDDENLERLELLTNLGRAVSLLAQSKLGRPDRASIEDIANEVAIWVDDDDPDIANAVLLWQCFLYHEIGKSERAFKALPLSLAPLKGRTSEFFLRLLRCSLLADNGRRALSLALILKMEERCSQWFSDEQTQRAAMCTLTWLRIQIAKSMESKLDGLSQEMRKDWLARAQAVLKDEQPPCKLLRLQHAVPMLFSRPQADRLPAPDIEPPTREIPEPTSQPTEQKPPPQR